MAVAIAVVGILAILSTNVRIIVVSVLKFAVELLVTFWKWAIIAFLVLLVFCCILPPGL